MKLGEPQIELGAVMWKRKRKLEAEAPEAAIFYKSGSGSGKHEMNGSGSGSGSSKKILEAEAIKNSPLPHHWLTSIIDICDTDDFDPIAEYRKTVDL